MLERIDERDGVTYTFRETPKSEATLFCVDRFTAAITLYHPTANIPECQIADLDGFYCFYGLFETLNVAANAIDDGVNQATCQYDGSKAAPRLPPLTDRARSLVEECRAVDHSDRIKVILRMSDESGRQRTYRTGH